MSRLFKDIHSLPKDSESAPSIDKQRQAKKPAKKRKKPTRILEKTRRLSGATKAGMMADPGCSGLTTYQRRFVDEFLADLNSVAAMRRLGYTGTNARVAAYQLRQIPAVKHAIKVGLDALSAEAKLDAVWIRTRLMALADGNVLDAVTFDAAGNPSIDPLMMPRAKAYGLDAIEIHEERVGGVTAELSEVNTGTSRPVQKMISGPIGEGEGGDSAEVKPKKIERRILKTKVKLADRLGALQKLGVMAGVFKDEAQAVAEVQFILVGAPASAPLPARHGIEVLDTTAVDVKG